MKKSVRRKVIGLVSLLSLLAILIPTAAWFSFKTQRDVNVKDISISAPFHLYLKDKTEKETFCLSIGNLHPGETLDIPFCVTNDPEGMDVSEEEKSYPKLKFAYELELARTENIPLEYTLFPAKKVDDEVVPITDIQIQGSDISILRRGQAQVAEGTINKGKYTLFTSHDSYKMEITNEDDAYNHDYYILRVTFEAGANLKNYEKETDLIYLSGAVNQTIDTTKDATP